MIKVLFFGQLREQVGMNAKEISAKGISTLADVKLAISSLDSNFAPLFQEGKLLMAINQEMSVQSQQVNDGDEVAFFPPVTGG